MRNIQRAHQTLQKAVKNGELKKPSACSVCGEVGKIVGHHEDYRKPKSVIWLCPSCHVKLHHIDRQKVYALDELTRAELRIMKLLAEGLMNQEIANIVGCGKRTVETHRERTYKKAKCRNVVELIRWGIGRGLLPEWTRETVSAKSDALDLQPATERQLELLKSLFRGVVITPEMAKTQLRSNTD